MNRRQAGKQETREKILAAARGLFADPGYEATTIRMIANAAGVAVGSVFTTFDGKEDVLAEIVFERYAGLAQALASALAETQGPVKQGMKAAFAAAYAYDVDRHAMLMHQISASWVWSAAFEVKSQANIAAPWRHVADVVREGIAKGEVRPDAPIPTLMDMFMSIYLRGWRAGWYLKLDAPGMAAFVAPQIDIVLDGVAP